MSRPKEPAYFVPERFAWREQAWYEQYFTAKPNRAASPARRHRTTRSGTCIPGVAEWMHAVIPDARIVYIVRDPIERIRSEWMHHVARGRIDDRSSEELRDPETSVIFPTSQLLLAARAVPRAVRARPRCSVLSSEQLTPRPERGARATAAVPRIDGGRAGHGRQTTASTTPLRSGGRTSIGRQLLDHPACAAHPAQRVPWVARTADRTARRGTRRRTRGSPPRCSDDVAALRSSRANPFAEWSL